MVTVTFRQGAANYIAPFVVTSKTTQGDFNARVYTLLVGGVFAFDEQSISFEDVQAKLLRYLVAATLTTFSVRYIEPGTKLFSVYGCSHIVVTQKL